MRPPSPPGYAGLVPLERPEQIFLRVYRQIRPRSPIPEVRLAFMAFANANSFIRLDPGGSLEIRVSDALQSAPGNVLEALAHILISKLARKRPERAFELCYRRYLNRKEIRNQLHLLRQARGRKIVSAPKGVQYDLEAMFDALNFRYFHGLMAQPALGWSKKPSRTTLGHYDPSHHVIVLSKTLDREQVPSIAVEYVLFHEMLHVKFPVEHGPLRRCVHTRDFKEAEKVFHGLREAKEALKRL